MEDKNINQILETITELGYKIDQLKQLLPATGRFDGVDDPYSSQEINELATALSKAQGDYQPIQCSRINKYFQEKYADHDDILKAILPVLSKNELSLIQQQRSHNDGTLMLHTILIHSSGQWIESRNRIICAKNNPQVYSSTLAHLKRTSAMALLGLTIPSDIDDDDAEIAMTEHRNITAKGIALNTKYNPKENSNEVISKDQLDELEYELEEYPDIAEQVLDGLKLQTLADMPKQKYHASITKIRKIKKVRNGE